MKIIALCRHFTWIFFHRKICFGMIDCHIIEFFFRVLSQSSMDLLKTSLKRMILRFQNNIIMNKSKLFSCFYTKDSITVLCIITSNNFLKTINSLSISRRQTQHLIITILFLVYEYHEKAKILLNLNHFCLCNLEILVWSLCFLPDALDFINFCLNTTLISKKPNLNCNQGELGGIIAKNIKG